MKEFYSSGKQNAIREAQWNKPRPRDANSIHCDSGSASAALIKTIWCE